MAAAVKASGSLHVQQPLIKWQQAVKGAVRFEQVVKESVIVLQIMEQNTRRLLKVRCRPRHASCLWQGSNCNAQSQAGLIQHSCLGGTLNTTAANYKVHGCFVLQRMML